MNLKFLLLLALIILGLSLRIYDTNWDQNQHLHPDERMITLVVMTLHLPNNPLEWKQLATPQSPLNPKFFAYGSLPIYLLLFISQLIQRFSYDDLSIIGRVLSALFDTGTLLLIYLLGKKVGNPKIGLWSAYFYAISVLPIQLSHFYAVDTILTFFITSTLLCLLFYYQAPKLLKAGLVGVFWGLSLATKISSLVLVLPVLVTFGLILLSNFPKPLTWLKYLPQIIKIFLFPVILIFAVALVTFLVVEPFALIDFKNFYQQNMQQGMMTKDAFTFPYTLQYVGIPHYFYQIKNIYLWGFGPILATLSFLGCLFLTSKIFFSRITKVKSVPLLAALTIILSFFWAYFGVVGNFEIGFMRYMLPLYPILTLSAAILFERLLSTRFNKLLKIFLVGLILILIIIWPLSFMHIYTKDNTRVFATKWIVQNIPMGGKIAVEHWDDTLPLQVAGFYQMFTLPLYDPDTVRKWQEVTRILNQTDYIIIASNRLYVPLSKLTDCSKLPPNRCYPITSRYYQRLFDGSLGFEKVAEFSITPEIEILGYNLDFNDFSADESFTVYDHPKVMIFKKNKYHSPQEFLKIIND